MIFVDGLAYPIYVGDLSAASVQSALSAAMVNGQGYTASASCTSDPVVVGTSCTVTSSAGNVFGPGQVAAVWMPYAAAGAGGSSTGSAGTLVVSNDLFNIDSAGGAQIAAAIVGVWAVGWAFRMAVKALHVDRGSVSDLGD